MPPHMGGKNPKGKAKNFKKSLKRMIVDFKNEKTLIIVVILFSMLSAILSILGAVYMKKIMDISGNKILDIDMQTATIKIQWSVFLSSFGTLLLFYISGALTQFASQFLATGISARYAYEMRQKVQRKIAKLPLSYFDKVPYGDTLSIGTNDVDNISRNLTQIITQIFVSVTMFLGTIIAMFSVKWQLALVALASLPFTLAIVFCISKFSGKQFSKYRKQLGVLNGQIEESYAGYKIVKLFNKEDDMIKEFNSKNTVLSKADYLSQFLSGFIFPSTIFINNIAYVAIAVVGGLLNDPVSMLTFFLFLNMFSRPFQQIGQIFNVIQSVVASGERIYELIDQEETVKDGFYFKDEQINTKTIKIVENPKYPNEFKVGSSITFNTYCKGDYTTKIEFEDKTLKHVGNTYIFNKPGTYTYYEFKKQNVEKDEELIKGNFEFKDVSFRYSEDKPLIDDFNLKVNQGDMVAIVGPTGAGKTTMVNLIMRFYELNGGNILLDSMPTTSYAIDTLRGSIGMVLQDTWLFKGTIKENLLFGDQNATEEEIIQACKEAHIYHFIQTLPGKFDYVLNEDGNNISQGQRQLLTIARAIISKPKILILDEATSSVDTRTESQIQDALDRIMKNKTSFVIAHRLSTIKNAKLIIVMKKGHIVETGTHKELLEKKGFYADLYNAQFSGVNPMKEQEGDILES